MEKKLEAIMHITFLIIGTVMIFHERRIKNHLMRIVLKSLFVWVWMMAVFCFVTIMTDTSAPAVVIYTVGYFVKNISYNIMLTVFTVALWAIALITTWATDKK